MKIREIRLSNLFFWNRYVKQVKEINKKEAQEEKAITKIEKNNVNIKA